MKIIIAGGTGFLGKSLSDYFKNKKCEVITLSRRATTHEITLSRKRNKNNIYWNGKSLGDWTQQLEHADVLINLAGKSVDCRYSTQNKKAILSSRIDSTRILNKAMERVENKPKVFLNASTATIYVHSETHLNTEENGVIGDDFSMGIARAWEKEFFSTDITGVRKVAMRTSIVLGKNGGALPKMKTITQLGMGGHQGRGQQFVSWIHVNDFCRAVDFLIRSNMSGAVNVTAPQPKKNHMFMKKLRKSLKMPIAINQPSWLLEIGAAIIGTETELLLKSRYVYPQRLLDAEFEFKYPDIDQCLESLSN